jgi:hypothetical protein
MKLLVTVLGIFILIGLVALACADMQDVGDDDTGSVGFRTVVVSQ